MTNNEEAMSMKKTLQSTNEKLKTAKVELRSKNEALNTGNTQLKEKLVSTHLEQDLTQVNICDSGYGMDAEVAAVLFPSLSSNKAHWLSVDLRISHSLIEGHNGWPLVASWICGGNFPDTMGFAP